MKNIPQIFNFNGAQLRMIEKDGQPWFVLKDVCDLLELRAPDVKQRLGDDVVSTHTVTDSIGRANTASIINEDGLYDVILESRKPEAKAFRKWVTSEVLPSIRKNGMYATDELLDNPDLLIQVATKLKEERQARLAAENLIEQHKPLVTFAEICMQSTDSVKIRDLAHSLSSHGIKIGQNKLFEKLREWKFIEIRSTEPTQLAIDKGLFEVVTGVKQKPSGDPFTWRTPYATVKGQVYIADRLRKGGEQDEKIN